MSIKFIRLNPTADKVGYTPKYVMQLATDLRFEHIGFPKPVRVGRNSVAFLEHEIEEWMVSRITERDEQGFTPATRNPRENHRRAKERQQAEASA